MNGAGNEEGENRLLSLVEEALRGYLEPGQRVRHIASKNEGTVLKRRGRGTVTGLKRFDYEYEVKWDVEPEPGWTWRANISPI